MSELIDFLSKQHLVWKGWGRGRDALGSSNHESNTHSSGYRELDQKLEGGLPKQGVLNINAAPGIGELRLLVPCMLQQMQAQERLCVFINPPGLLCAEFLYHQGFDLQRTIVIHTKDKNEALWASELCAKSGACSSVLLWNNYFEVHQIKRLQLASDEGQCLQVLLRSPKHVALSLPVALSLKLTPHQQGLVIEVLKRKGGWPVAEFALDMSSRWPALSLAKPDNVLPFPALKTHRAH